ncbi:MAG TPA: DUF1905 domain-containing protein [Micromonosporaceae bacterium]
MAVTFDAELWLWDARRSDAWTFVTVPADISAEVRELAGAPRRGFGSARPDLARSDASWVARLPSLRTIATPRSSTKITVLRERSWEARTLPSSRGGWPRTAQPFQPVRMSLSSARSL